MLSKVMSFTLFLVLTPLAALAGEGVLCVTGKLPPPTVENPLADSKPLLHLSGGNPWLGCHPHRFQFEFSIVLSWHRHTSIFIKILLAVWCVY